MNIKEAEETLGNRATFELQNMRKALSMLQLLNTPEEDKRLEATKVMLKARRSK